MGKKIWSANYNDDGFSVEYYSDQEKLPKNDFVVNLEKGFSENIIEPVLLIDNARVNFNYIKSSGPLHSHNHYEIDLVVAGEIQEFDGSKAITMKRNELVIVSPLNYHSYTKIDNDSSYTIMLNVSLRDEFFVGELKNFCAFNFPQHIILSEEETNMIIDMLMLAYKHRNDSDDFSVQLLQQSAINYIVSLLFVHLSHGNSENDIKYKNDLISAIIFINANYSKDITCAIVAKKCGYSPNYFSSAFKKMTGTSFSEYLLNVRLEHARYMLIVNKTPIITISESCGFRSPSYFSLLFKQRYGKTPGDYREENSQFQ